MSSTQKDILAADNNLQKMVQRLQMVEEASIVTGSTGADKKASQETKKELEMSWISAFEPYTLDDIHFASAPPLLNGKKTKLKCEQLLQQTNVKSWAGSLYFKDQQSLERYRKHCIEIAIKMDPKTLKSIMLTSQELKMRSRKFAQKIMLAQHEALGISTFANADIKKGECLLYGSCASIDEISGVYAATSNIPLKSEEFAYVYMDGQSVRDFSGWAPHLPSEENLKDQYEFINYNAHKVATANLEPSGVWVSDLKMFVMVLTARSDIKKGEILGYDYEYTPFGWDILNVMPKLVEKTGAVIPSENYYRKTLTLNFGVKSLVMPCQVLNSKESIILVNEDRMKPFSQQGYYAVLDKSSFKKILEASCLRMVPLIEPDAFLTEDILSKIPFLLSETMLKYGISQFSENVKASDALTLGASAQKWMFDRKEQRYISAGISFSEQEMTIIEEKLKTAPFAMDSLEHPLTKRLILSIDLSNCYKLAKEKKWFAVKEEVKESKEAKEEETAAAVKDKSTASIGSTEVTDKSAEVVLQADPARGVAKP